MKNKLKQAQPLVYQTLYHAMTRGRNAHAYLFYGPKGTGKLATALLFAKSLVCDHSDPFACETCAICQRIQENHYSDLRILDGSETSIKKKDIMSLQEAFSRTALEKGKKIYIINAVENTTAEGLNALLKFLEEPSSSDMTAILISEQMDRILPTIVSRCQLIPFRPMRFLDGFQEVKGQLEPLDAYLLAHLFHQKQRIEEAQESEVYQHARYLFTSFLTQEHNSLYDGHLFLTMEAFPASMKKMHKTILQYLIDFLSIFYKDCMKGSTLCEDSWYQNEINQRISRSADYHKVLKALLEAKDKMHASVNLPLLLDQLMYKMQ